MQPTSAEDQFQLNSPSRSGKQFADRVLTMERG
jgi:hypothetical protein